MIVNKFHVQIDDGFREVVVIKVYVVGNKNVGSWFLAIIESSWALSAYPIRHFLVDFFRASSANRRVETGKNITSVGSDYALRDETLIWRSKLDSFIEKIFQTLNVSRVRPRRREITRAEKLTTNKAIISVDNNELLPVVISVRQCELFQVWFIGSSWEKLRPEKSVDDVDEFQMVMRFKIVEMLEI